MALPEFTMRQLLEAGVHFGHQTHRWNPKMSPYIYGARGGIHIIDLSQTMPALHRALVQVREVVASGGRVLFVGTKRQASKPIAEAARRCGQYYVDHRWLGGMLTNWQTISKSITMLKQLDEKLSAEDSGLTKKELLQMTRHRDKLERSLGGIRDMGGLPDIIFIIDTNREDIAINEARRLAIPVVAILDTNCDPDGIAFPVPGNDDATRAIEFYCELVSAAVLDGIEEEMKSRGADLGAIEEPVPEPVLEAIEAATAAAATSSGKTEAAEAETPQADVAAAKSGKKPDPDRKPAEVAKPAKEEGVLFKVIKKAKKALKTSKPDEVKAPEKPKAVPEAAIETEAATESAAKEQAAKTKAPEKPKAVLEAPKKAEAATEPVTEEKAAETKASEKTVVEAKKDEEKPAEKDEAKTQTAKKPVAAKKITKSAAGPKKKARAAKKSAPAAKSAATKKDVAVAKSPASKKGGPKTALEVKKSETETS